MAQTQTSNRKGVKSTPFFNKLNFCKPKKKLKMMYRLLVLVFLFSANVARGQMLVDGMRLDSNVQFIEIRVFDVGLVSSKMVVQVGYGQKVTSMTKESNVTDNGKDLVVQSVVGALNYFYKNGWNYVESRLVDNGIRYYLLRRKQF